jgi:serine/threonine protein kinase
MEPSSDDDRTVLPGQAMAIAVGDRLRDWEIESFLGSGSFGTVWKARRSRLGGYQFAAVKILDRIMVGNVREQLIAEFNLLSSIEHPNLLRYLDAFEIEEGRLFGFVVFVLELAVTDLRNAIAQSSTGLPEKDMCAAFSALAAGLAAFHTLGHSHGDIKPANILRVGNVWKLADFGIAAPLDGSYSLVGGTTFDYCPPEELLGVVDPLGAVPETGGRRVHRTADVWALAISLHYAIAKRHPFSGESVRARIVSVVSDVKHLSPSLSPELAELLDKHCLTPSHHNRISASELSGQLLALAGPRSVRTETLAEERISGRVEASVEASVETGVQERKIEAAPLGISDTLAANAGLTKRRARTLAFGLVAISLLLAALIAWKLSTGTNNPVDPIAPTETSLVVAETAGSPNSTSNTQVSNTSASDPSAPETLASDTIIVDDTPAVVATPSTAVGNKLGAAEQPLGIPPMPDL